MPDGSERANGQDADRTTLYGTGDTAGYIPTCLCSIIHAVVVKEDSGSNSITIQLSNSNLQNIRNVTLLKC